MAWKAIKEKGRRHKDFLTWSIADCEGVSCAVLFRQTDYWGKKADNDAALAAAAPDLLKALLAYRRAYELLKGCNGWKESNGDVWAGADAIAEAALVRHGLPLEE